MVWALAVLSVSCSVLAAALWEVIATEYPGILALLKADLQMLPGGVLAILLLSWHLLRLRLTCRVVDVYLSTAFTYAFMSQVVWLQ